MKNSLTLLVPFSLMIATGCSNKGNVSGKVTLNGQPVLSGTVMMAGSPKGIPVYGVIRNGTYTIKEVAAGNVYVAVNSPRRMAAPPRDGSPPPPPPSEVTGWFPIPSHYNDFLSSGLKFTVEKGDNTFDIDLTGAPSPAAARSQP